MPPPLAAVTFIFGILWLFKLDRQAEGQTSKAVWIPVLWLLIAGSRNVGEWLNLGAPVDRGARYLEGNPLDRAVLSTLIALGVVVLLTRRRQVGALFRASTPVLLFFFYCGFSSLWSDFPDVSFKRWFRGLGDVVMVLVILTDPDWVSALKKVLARVGFLLLPLSVLFIRYFPAWGRGYNAAGTGTFWTGVTSDKNGLGMICLIFGLGAVWRFIEIYQAREGEDRTKPLLARGILVMTTLYLLWESDSMTSISCFVLAGSLMLATGRWPLARRPAITFLLAATAVGVSAFVLFGGATGVLQAMGRNPTLTGRTEVWNVVLPFAQNPILGAGYESFWLGDRLSKIGELTSNGIQEAHNGYLEIFLNLGWMGLILLALVIATGYRKVALAIRQDPFTGKVRFAYFVLALIYNFTEAGFKMMNPVWIFFLLAVMAPPKPSVSESAETIAVYPSSRFAASKQRSDYAFDAGFRKETR